MFDPHSQVSKMRFHERNVHEAKIEDTRCQVCQKVLTTITSRKRHEAIEFFCVRLEKMRSRIGLHNVHTLTLGSCGNISCDLLGWTSQPTGSDTIHTQMVLFCCEISPCAVFYW